MTIYEKLYKKFGPSPSQEKIIELVGKNKKVLEIGSSSGYMTALLKKNGCIVDALEIDIMAIHKVKKIAREVFMISIEDKKVIALRQENYDFIVLADVLEHLANPGKALDNIHSIADKNTQIIISTPNIACWPMRKQLFFKGDFEYSESGLLDRTHLHFFTVVSLLKLVKEKKFQTVKVFGTITILPFDHKVKKIPLLGVFYYQFLRPIFVRKHPNFSYYHFVTLIKKHNES